jgi:hypothetical protein
LRQRADALEMQRRADEHNASYVDFGRRDQARRADTMQNMQVRPLRHVRLGSGLVGEPPSAGGRRDAVEVFDRTRNTRSTTFVARATAKERESASPHW